MGIGKIFEIRINYPNMFDSENTDSKLPKTSHPTFLIFDRSGYLVYYSTGYSKTDMKKLEEIIEVNL